MDTQEPYNSPQASQTTPSAASEKHGKGLLVALVILILVALAFAFAGNRAADDQYENGQETQSTQAEADDLDSIEADLEASAFEGVSESL